MKIENKLLTLSNNGKSIVGENDNQVKVDFLSVLGNELTFKEDLIEIKESNIKYEINIEDKYIVEYENNNIDENLIELIVTLFNNTKVIDQTKINEEMKLENFNIISDLKTVFNNQVSYDLNNVSLSEEQVESINENVKKLSSVYFEKIVLDDLSIEQNGFIDQKIRDIKEVMKYIENNLNLSSNSIKSNEVLSNIISDLINGIYSYSNNDRVVKNEIINSNSNNKDVLKLEDLELTFNKNIILENIKIENEVDNELNILNKIAFNKESFNEVKSELFTNNNGVKKVNLELIIDNKCNSLKNIDSSYKSENSNIILNLNNTITNSYNDKIVEIKQPQNIRNGYVSQDIVQAINYLNSNNIEELNVKMNPKDLGEINIKLIKTRNEEKCIITLSKEESFNLLKENVNEIKTHLSNLEINMKEISVEIKSNNQKDFSDNLNQNFNKNNTKDQKRNNRQEIQENEIVKDSNEDILNIDLMV